MAGSGPVALLKKNEVIQPYVKSSAAGVSKDGFRGFLAGYNAQ